ncbi:MAG: AI-2E family transporter [Nitrospirota bacterium]|nr:AI-2E family transporter [Nitrospirota bacterium]
MMKEPDMELLKEVQKVHHQTPRWVIGLLLTGLLVITAYYTASLLILLLISGILAYLLSNVIKRIEYLGIKRTVAVAAVYFSAGLLLVAADIILIPCLQQETKNLTEKLPEITQQAENAFVDLRGYPFAEDMIDKILSSLAQPSHLLSKMLNLSDLFSQAASVAFAMILIPFFVFFILKDWPALLKKIMRWIPSAYVETSIAAMSEIDILAGRYLRGLAIQCSAVGVMASVGLAMLGVNYPVTLGIVTAAANVIPYVGPIVSCLIACLIAFIQFKTIGAVINVLFLYAGVKLLDDFVVQPLTIGRSVKLHPMLLVITIIAGQQLFGIMGMVLAVPAVTIIQKVAVIFLEDRRNRAVHSETLKPSHEIIV